MPDLPKTNAARALDRLGILYELHGYRPDADDLSVERLSIELAVPPATLFKTIVCLGDRTRSLFAVLPLGLSLDLKALARLSGNKRVELAALKDVRALTGYERGAVTALAAKKPFPVFLHDSALTLPRIGVSAGVLGGELLLAPRDYLRATGGTAGPIADKAAP